MTSKSRVIRKYRDRFQPESLSLLEHNETLYTKYDAKSSFWSAFFDQQKEIINTPQFPLNLLLDGNRKFENIFDIGAGPGWLSEYLAKYGKQVFAIEPSTVALKIAATHAVASNVTFIQGFAQDFLHKFPKNDSRTLFVCQSVLQHLSDRSTKKILSAINSFSNASICFAEPYSKDISFNYGTTNIRRITWWEKNLSTYNLDFCGEDVSHLFNRTSIYKGIIGRSARNYDDGIEPRVKKI